MQSVLTPVKSHHQLLSCRLANYESHPAISSWKKKTAAAQNTGMKSGVRRGGGDFGLGMDELESGREGKGMEDWLS
jgi:hypothetical protein